jgi:HPt (histidine-containing phosphotransfer) domain-containing protein
MTTKKPNPTSVKTYVDHEVITPPHHLRGAARPIGEHDRDDPVARAEQALRGLSGQFADWMHEECEKLVASHGIVRREGFIPVARDNLYRAAHDIKGQAATFGYPAAAAAAESLCRIMDHAPELAAVPAELIDNHVKAILAIVREHARIDAADVADALSRRLRAVADEYLAHVNRDRPEHLEAIMAPSIVPGT